MSGCVVSSCWLGVKPQQLRIVALCQRQTPFDNTVPLQVQLTLTALLGNLLCHAFILFQLAESFLLEVGLKEE